MSTPLCSILHFISEATPSDFSNPLPTSPISPLPHKTVVRDGSRKGHRWTAAKWRLFMSACLRVPKDDPRHSGLQALPELVMQSHPSLKPWSIPTDPELGLIPSPRSTIDRARNAIETIARMVGNSAPSPTPPARSLGRVDRRLIDGRRGMPVRAPGRPDRDHAGTARAIDAATEPGAACRARGHSIRPARRSKRLPASLARLPAGNQSHPTTPCSGASSLRASIIATRMR